MNGKSLIAFLAKWTLMLDMRRARAAKSWKAGRKGAALLLQVVTAGLRVCSAGDCIATVNDDMTDYVMIPKTAFRYINHDEQ